MTSDIRNDLPPAPCRLTIGRRPRSSGLPHLEASVPRTAVIDRKGIGAGGLNHKGSGDSVQGGVGNCVYSSAGRTSSVDNDAAAEFRIHIEDGGVLANAYTAADFIL